ncbi:MAG: hypothetical protein ACT4NJ_04460 [Nitrosopumilaceae archaeon]
MDPEIKKTYDTLTPRAQQVYDVLEKYGELKVREIVKKAQMQTQTVEKCLDELSKSKLASYYERPKRRKCWFLIKQERMQYDEIMKTIDDELAELKNFAKQVEKAYRNSPDTKTFAEIIRVGQLILEELSIPTIMYMGVNEGDRLKHWTYYEQELKKILLELMNIDMKPIRTVLKLSKAVSTSNLRTDMRNSLNQTSDSKTSTEVLQKN